MNLLQRAQALDLDALAELADMAALPLSDMESPLTKEQLSERIHAQQSLQRILGDPATAKTLIIKLRAWEALATTAEHDPPGCPLCLAGVYDYEKDGEWIHENGEKCPERRPALSIKEKRDIAVDALKECRGWGGSEVDCERIVDEALSKIASGRCRE